MLNEIKNRIFEKCFCQKIDGMIYLNGRCGDVYPNKPENKNRFREKKGISDTKSGLSSCRNSWEVFRERYMMIGALNCITEDIIVAGAGIIGSNII